MLFITAEVAEIVWGLVFWCWRNISSPPPPKCAWLVVSTPFCVPYALWHGWKQSSILNQTHYKPLGLPSHTPWQTEPQGTMYYLEQNHTLSMMYIFRGITFSAPPIRAQAHQYLNVRDSRCSELQPSMITHFYWTFATASNKLHLSSSKVYYLCPLWNETLLQSFHAFYASKRYLNFIENKLHASDLWVLLYFCYSCFISPWNQTSNFTLKLDYSICDSDDCDGVHGPN